MNGIDIFQTFGGKDPFEIFTANAINAMPGELLTPLIDKELVLELGLWGDTVFSDIELEQMTGLGFKLYETESIAFSQDTERLLNGIKIIEIQGCDFTGPGAGIVKQMEQRIISEPFFPFQINRLKDLQHLILIKKSDKAPLFAFLGNIEDGIYDPLLIRMHKANHFSK